LFATLGATTLMAVSLVTSSSNANAAISGFRLSNFGAFVAEVCVYTDVASQCTGRFATNRSEVWNIRHNSPNFVCRSKVWTGYFDEYVVNTSPVFSRNTYKECVIHGTVANRKLDLIRIGQQF
jgi:hypothetical protein